MTQNDHIMCFELQYKHFLRENAKCCLYSDGRGIEHPLNIPQISLYFLTCQSILVAVNKRSFDTCYTTVTVEGGATPTATPPPGLAGVWPVGWRPLPWQLLRLLRETAAAAKITLHRSPHHPVTQNTNQRGHIDNIGWKTAKLFSRIEDEQLRDIWLIKECITFLDPLYLWLLSRLLTPVSCFPPAPGPAQEILSTISLLPSQHLPLACHLATPIRGQYSCHVISIDQ